MSEISVMTVPLKFVNHSIEDYAMQVTYDPVSNEGRVVYNLALIKNEDLEFAISMLKDANKTGLTVSGRTKFFSSGEKVDEYIVPERVYGDQHHLQHNLRWPPDPSGNSHYSHRRGSRGDRKTDSPEVYPYYPV